MNSEINKKINKNKNIIILIIILVVILVLALTISALKQDRSGSPVITEEEPQDNEEEPKKPREAEVSEIEAGELPSAEELGALGLDNVIQSPSITEQFNLSRYDEQDGGIRYSYLANKLTSGERLYVYARAMTEEEYDEMLPDGDTQTGSLGDGEATFNNRNLYHTTDDAKLSENVKRSEEEGKIVVRYGNSTTEILPMQQLMWYKDGIGYTLESINRQYTIDDMLRLARAYIGESE